MILDQLLSAMLVDGHQLLWQDPGMARTTDRRNDKRVAMITVALVVTGAGLFVVGEAVMSGPFSYVVMVIGALVAVSSFLIAEYIRVVKWEPVYPGYEEDGN